jgi:hypothetical protein
MRQLSTMRSTRPGRFAVAGLLLASTVVLSLPGVQSASATTPTCSGSSCVGKVAETTGCSADELLIEDSSEATNGNDIKIYYSDTCKTVWAMYTQIGTSPVGTAEILTVPNAGGLEQPSEVALASVVGRTIGKDEAIETPMTLWDQSFKVCGLPTQPTITIDPEPDGATSPNPTGWCTTWH